MAQRLLMFRPLSIFCLFLFLVCSCNKSNVKWLHYDETNCADKWDYTVNNEKLKNDVVEYLAKKGIKVFEIEIFGDGTKDNCTECSCRTGRRIKCKVKNRDVKAIKSEGFY